MITRLSVISVLLLTFLPVAAPAADPGFPLVQALASFPFDEEAEWLERGRLTSTLTLSAGNVFMFSPDGSLVSDLESLEVTLALRVGIFRSLTLEMYSRWSGIHGGWMDGIIENFHDAFGLPDNGRPIYARNRVDYKLQGVFERERSAGVTGPVTLALSSTLAPGREFRLGARLAIQASLAASPGLLSGRPALIAGGWLQWRRGNIALGLAGHMAFFDAPAWLGDVSITPRIFLAEAWARLGWFRAGMIRRSSPFRSGDQSHPGWQILLGVRLLRGVELRFQEDLAPFDSTPDVRFSIRLRLDQLARRRKLG
ncbi:MAG TPA: DUF3187 family protein [Candidatus Aminicenantes bacterium]|nr:DUF3187 family protein [Candidatus Aminicenantes bacterium]